MKELHKMLIVLAVISTFSQNIHAQSDYSQQWPSFRGPWGLGYLENAKTAINWDSETGEHIKWKTAIPGLGHSCPVIWNNYILPVVRLRC